MNQFLRDKFQTLPPKKILIAIPGLQHRIEYIDELIEINYQ